MNAYNRNSRNQLSKSLEQILEDAFLGVELSLSGRNLKDIPKHPNYDLSDTVLADLSENRFEDIPDEVFTYEFMEKLLLSNNLIKHIPDAISSLQSLTYLDLSNNQLSELPREICTLPLEILLVAENQLSGLPKEMGKMTALQELDASWNRISQIPMTIGDMSSLKALNLSNNQISLLPLQVTYLQLEYLDVSCNCITSLPAELRHMSSLIELNINHNPMVSPPTTVCLDGILHIYHYLESLSNKDTLTHRRDDVRRSVKHPYVNHAPVTSGSNTLDCIRTKNRYNVDSGYSTCDGIDKRWSNEAPNLDDTLTQSGRSTPSTPSTLSPGTLTKQLSANDSKLSSDIRLTPESINTSNGDDKIKVSSTLTYRQYKEALRQQRQQDVYRPRGDQSSPSDAESSPHSQNQSPVHMPNPLLTNGHTTLPNSLVYNKSNIASTPTSQTLPSSPLLHSTPRRYPSSIPQSLSSFQNGTNGNDTPTPNGNEQNKRPVQKVVPSRNTNKTYNGIENARNTPYIKPLSPTKSPLNTLQSLRSGIPARKDSNGIENGNSPKLLTTTVAYLKGASVKPAGGSGRLSWNKDVPPDKLSFTMKREFDKQKEEADLLVQLRTILELRLKMSLPADLAPVLADGVVLCHLANNLRPRSVASVHVPSPAQPKLTMARCRRNVENFLDACRRMGVEEECLCLTDDVLEAECDEHLVPLAVTALRAHQLATPPPYRNVEERFVSNFNAYTIHETDETQELYVETEFKGENFIEERIQQDYTYVNESVAQRIECFEAALKLRNSIEVDDRNISYVIPVQKHYFNGEFELVDTDEVDYARVDCETEIYDRQKMNLDLKKNFNVEQDSDRVVINPNGGDKIVTFLTLGTFFLAVILLYMFPLQ